MCDPECVPGASCLVDWLLKERVYLAMETIVFELCYSGELDAQLSRGWG